jgi:GDP-mannose 6-dehydrogenase
MKIAVFGLGYVGVVSAACLARDGHTVSGVDPNTVKVDFLRQGKSPIVEPGLEDLIAAAVAAGRLFAGSDYAAAVAQCDVLMVCVGTPGQANGSLDLTYVRRVVQQIGEQLAEGDRYRVVVIRSTLLPGSMQGSVIPILEQSSRRQAGKDFGVCINPEFLREGSAICDYDHPPKTVIGASDERAAGIVRELYAALNAPVVVTDLRTAEMVKYVDNSWHALKVTFANEVGRLCKAMGIDGRHVMRLFCMDTKLTAHRQGLRAHGLRPERQTCRLNGGKSRIHPESYTAYRTAPGGSARTAPRACGGRRLCKRGIQDASAGFAVRQIHHRSGRSVEHGRRQRRWSRGEL